MVDIGRSGSVCEREAGIDLQGERVVVRDAEGAVVAEGALGPGARPTGPPVPRTRVCRFQATLEVPDRPSYSVRVDGGDEVTYARAGLERGPVAWVVWYVGLRSPPADSA